MIPTRRRRAPRRPKLDRRTAWRTLAAAEGGELEEAKRPSGDRVHFRHGPWRIRLDTYTQSAGETYVTYTRLRTYFPGHRDLRVTVRRRSFFDRLWAGLGFGNPLPVSRELQERWVVKGKPEPRVPSLFAGSGLVEAIRSQERFHLYVKRPGRKSRKKWGEDVGVLVCRTTGVITDPERLAGMLRVVRETLDALHRLGEADRRELPAS